MSSLLKSISNALCRLNTGSQKFPCSILSVSQRTLTTVDPSADTTKQPPNKSESLGDQETTGASTKPPNEPHFFERVQANKIERNLGWQPTVETHSKLMINGTSYNKLPLVSIKSSKNNTILTLSDAAGVVLHSTSSGVCGFKNSKKSTAVAGQAAGLAMSENAKRRGIEHIRVIVKGFGNGRLASIKALQMGKLNIVSITDATPIPMAFARPPRPPARRKL